MLTITEHGKFTVQINEHSKLTVQEWHVLYESFKTTKTPDVDTLRQFLAAPYTKVFKQADRELPSPVYAGIAGETGSTHNKAELYRENDDALTIVFNKQSIMGNRYQTKKHHRNYRSSDMAKTV